MNSTTLQQHPMEREQDGNGGPLLFPIGKYQAACTYCPPHRKKSSSLKVSVGAYAHQLPPSLYAYLLDRNCRRSGNLLYAPLNHETCCAQHAIRVNVNATARSRSHLKVLKKLKRWLRDGGTHPGAYSTTSDAATSSGISSSSRYRTLSSTSYDSAISTDSNDSFDSCLSTLSLEKETNASLHGTSLEALQTLASTCPPIDDGYDSSTSSRSKGNAVARDDPLTALNSMLAHTVPEIVSGLLPDTVSIPDLLASLDKKACRFTVSPLRHEVCKMTGRKADYSSNAAIVLRGLLAKRSFHTISTEQLASKLAEPLRASVHVDSVQVCKNGYINVWCTSSLPISMPISPTFTSSPCNLRQSGRRSSVSLSKDGPPELPSARFRLTLTPGGFRDDEYQLYKRYQLAVHGEETNQAHFQRFLCTSLLPAGCGGDVAVGQFTHEHGLEWMDHAKKCGLSYGSYHLRYELESPHGHPSVLLGTSVVDVLPLGISSVYFFYDPDYAFASLGVFSALVEMEMVTRLPKMLTLPSDDMELGADGLFYYLGYWIHECPKMKYKLHFDGAQILHQGSWESVSAVLSAIQTEQCPQHSLPNDALCSPPPTSEYAAGQPAMSLSDFLLHSYSGDRLFRQLLFTMSSLLTADRLFATPSSTTKDAAPSLQTSSTTTPSTSSSLSSSSASSSYISRHPCMQGKVFFEYFTLSTPMASALHDLFRTFGLFFMRQCVFALNPETDVVCASNG